MCEEIPSASSVSSHILEISRQHLVLSKKLVESNQVVPDPEAPADTIAEPVSGEQPAQPDESRWDIWRGPNQKSKKASLQKFFEEKDYKSHRFRTALRGRLHRSS